MDNYYSVEQVALRYSVGKKIVYELIKSGELQAIQVGKKFLRVSRAELQRWETAQLQNKAQGE